jgi:hypothetical protein
MPRDIKGRLAVGGLVVLAAVFGHHGNADQSTATTINHESIVEGDWVKSNLDTGDLVTCSTARNMDKLIQIATAHDHMAYATMKVTVCHDLSATDGPFQVTERARINWYPYLCGASARANESCIDRSRDRGQTEKPRA